MNEQGLTQKTAQPLHLLCSSMFPLLQYLSFSDKFNFNSSIAEHVYVYSLKFGKSTRHVCKPVLRSVIKNVYNCTGKINHPIPRDSLGQIISTEGQNATVTWQTILMKYHTFFFSKIRKDIAKFVVCCSRDLKAL